MPRIHFSEYGNSPFEQLIGHNPSILTHWVALEDTLFHKTSLSPDLLEQVRRTIAFENECEYCMVKGGKPTFTEHDQQTNLACAFAQLFVIDNKSIKEEQFDTLRQAFTNIQISELCSFIAFITACQKLGNIYHLTEDFQKNAVTNLQELKNSF